MGCYHFDITHEMNLGAVVLMFDNLAFSGLLTSVWLVLGVIIAARFYPQYDHKKQFMSELGAKGGPTEKLSPMINNYPLGFLFCLFGYSILQLKQPSVLIDIAAWLIIAHGIGTWIAGYFPMDLDPYIEKPSMHCQIHSLAGGIMLLSLLVAQVLILFSPVTEQISIGFKIFSGVTIFATFYFSYTLMNAYKNKINAGLHQRLSYGAQILWLSGFSWVLM